MTEEEEKLLLLKDLSARLPYDVILNVNNGKYREDRTLGPDLFNSYALWDAKPYLRSMSLMTEEEKEELSKRYVWGIRSGQIQIRYHSEGCWDDETECSTEEYIILFDWLNKHHLDYRGLINLGLALEAPKGMYK